MTLPDLVGHLGYLSIALGLWFISRGPQVRGWLLRAIGDAVWVVVGFWVGLSSIVLWSSIFCLIDTLGFLRARKKIRATS